MLKATAIAFYHALCRALNKPDNSGEILRQEFLCWLNNRPTEEKLQLAAYMKGSVLEQRTYVFVKMR